MESSPASCYLLGAKIRISILLFEKLRLYYLFVWETKFHAVKNRR